MKQKHRSNHSRVALGVIMAVLILAIAGGTAYLLLRPHSKMVAQVNGVTITEQDLDQQLAFPLSQTPAILLKAMVLTPSLKTSLNRRT